MKATTLYQIRRESDFALISEHASARIAEQKVQDYSYGDDTYIIVPIAYEPCDCSLLTFCARCEWTV